MSSKYFAWDQRFPGNLVPRFPGKIPPWPVLCWRKVTIVFDWRFHSLNAITLLFGFGSCLKFPPKFTIINPIPHSIFFSCATWGLDSTPPLLKSPGDYFWSIFLHTSNGIHTERFQNFLHVPIFKIKSLTHNWNFFQKSKQIRCLTSEAHNSFNCQPFEP